MQDGLLGAYNLSVDNQIDWQSMMNMLSAAQIDDLGKFTKNKNYTGKEIFSNIIPDRINMHRQHGDKIIITVKNGEITQGILDSTALGVLKKNNLIQLVWDEYGVDATQKFIDNTTRLTTNFNLYHGFTVGIGDLDISQDLYKKMYQLFETKKLEVKHEITEVENNPDMMDEGLFELTIKSKLDVILGDISTLIMNNLKPNNNFKIMIESGSKGKPIQIGQMGGCVGQQDYQGGRILKNYNNRSLMYFFKNDDRAESRGFVENSFIKGLNISEFIFHHLTSREGLIDSTIKSVTADTMITIIENSKPKTVKIGDWINQHMDIANKQDPNLIERESKQNFELLNVKDIYIPTLDEEGNVTWGAVTALTRHDPGKIIYEVKTKSGRYVKVPESKSLLIWNSESNKFEDKLTPDVKLGDKVPVTMRLCEPPVITNSIDMTEYFPKTEYLYGSDFIKAQEEIESAMVGREKIPAGWWEKSNGTLFTLPYKNKGLFQRAQSGRSDISNIKAGCVYSFNAKKDSSIPDKFVLNKENGQFIGLFLADGNVDFESGYIQITKSDESVLKFVENYFDKIDIKHKRNKRVTERGTIIDVRGYSRVLCKFLDEFVGHGAHEKHIPDTAFTAPKEFAIGLIDGFISGDGCITNSSITASSCSLNLINGFNMLLSRFGIFSYINTITYDNDLREIKANYDTYAISIRAQWATKFKEQIGSLINGAKNEKLIAIKPSAKKHPNYVEQQDIVLDEITEINHLDVKDYPKLYDMTIPSTFNFIISSGMGTRDTAESGYIQRKLIKSTEDFMIKYDGTVRNAVERIQQFIYGDSGVDTVRQYEYKFKMMEMSNPEIKEKYAFTKEEIGKLKDWTDKDNNQYYRNVLAMRDNLRRTQIKASVDYLALNIGYMLPVNLTRIIDNFKNNQEKDHKVLQDPNYIIEKIEQILLSGNTRLYSMTEEEIKNTKSVKNMDDAMSKTAFKYALYDALAPKKCILHNKFSKSQIDAISDQIIKSFNKAIVEPGEMVGIIAAQSLGEPVTQMTLNAFHNSGVGGLGAVNTGVPRIKEIFSLSKNPKEPVMYIYIDKDHKQHGKKDFANKIASHIKFTTIKDLRNKLEIFYDPRPYDAGGFMEHDNVYNIFHSFQQSKTCCQSKIDGLPWLMRIEFDKEKLLNKEVTLLDIKSQFCVAWDKRYQDVKGMKREKRQLLEKINQLAIVTNTDNDTIPIMHIRFDMTNFNSVTLVDFMDMFVDDFKLKGMEDIEDIRGGKPNEERIISFDNPEQSFEKNNEYVIYTKGINMIDIRKIIGVDLNRTFCSDIITTYEIFGIEAARNLIIHDIIQIFNRNGSGVVNYQHISIFGDIMTNVGNLTSIDRHGLNKLDTDPFSRASFEKTVEQLITAAIFNEVDHMKSVSSRIMAGLCIKGGTGLCNLILDRELLENSEYTTDIGQLYQKTYEDILPSQNTQEIDTDVFIPEL